MTGDGLLRSLIDQTPTRILLVVMDGLGDMRSPDHLLTPLEAARTPHFDALASQSALGRLIPVLPGITPGSGPGHLALFGYDPTEFIIGRGVLEAVGLDMPLSPGDVAARGNFCTIGKDGRVTDRRAGRIPTDMTRELCARIARKLHGSGDGRLLIQPGMSHRFCVVFQGRGLSDELSDADPQKEGKAVPPVKALSKRAVATAKRVNAFIRTCAELLADEPQANGVLLRGFSKRPDLPPMRDRYGLEPACIATYPMYKGLARLVGMEVLSVHPPSGEGQIKALMDARGRFTFFYFHWKATDQAGEDGHFDEKVSAIERMDQMIPTLRNANPDVIAVTGDHSSPVPLKAHSWHPVPVLIWSSRGGGDGIERFSETHCNHGSIGILPMVHLMPLLLANALKLKKYGA